MSKIQKAHNLLNLFSKVIVFTVIATLSTYILPVRQIVFGSPQTKLENLPSINFSKIDYSKKENGYMIRLHNERDGEFFCSGFVISDHYAITAAHCIVMDMEYPELKVSGIKIYNERMQDTGIVAQAASANARADYGIIIGDFSKFTKAKLDYKPTSIIRRSPALMTCGYPWGATAACYYFRPTGNFFSQMAAEGFMFPGMSGGPVVDAVTGEVFAVNSAVTNGRIIVSPLVGVFDVLSIKVEGN